MGSVVFGRIRVDVGRGAGFEIVAPTEGGIWDRTEVALGWEYKKERLGR